MRPGEGREDRGAQGLVKAFFGTCVKSITSPGLLLDHIRRADTPGEGRQFAIGCSVLWAISVAIHGIIWNVMHPGTKEQLDWDPGWIGKTHAKAVVLGIIVGVAVYFLLVSAASRMYFALISTEVKNNAPRVLIYNIFCYCMGPSLVALVPVIGPPLALVLILRAWSVAGAKRLYVSWRGAIVATVLSMIAVLIGISAVLFVGDSVLANMFSLHVPTREEQGLPPEVKAPAAPGAARRSGVQP